MAALLVLSPSLLVALGRLAVSAFLSSLLALCWVAWDGFWAGCWVGWGGRWARLL